MPISIEGKKVLVTGGARGIGGETARYFAKHGANVVTFDVKDDEGQDLARRATEAGPGSITYRNVNVADVEEVRAGVDFAVSELGGLDAVLNTAGISRSAPAETTPQADWDDQLDINMKGLAYVCEASFPHLKERGGAILNFAAGAALMDVPLHSAAYSASKGAVISYTRTVAREWARYGIRVNSINPAVMTPIVAEHHATMTPEDQEQYDREIADQIPLGGKLGDIETDLAPALLFFISDASKFITSQIVGIDGGLTYTR